MGGGGGGGGRGRGKVTCACICHRVSNDFKVDSVRSIFFQDMLNVKDIFDY